MQFIRDQPFARELSFYTPASYRRNFILRFLGEVVLCCSQLKISPKNYRLSTH